ncbi:hypothetical protein RJ41_05660 [Alteromonas marina]|uniref:Uncharacterized protein n=1 Tax=Alteromonas marina TaxID=203795 RepID=A0A0B3YCA8_9ALTE|nr:hypothetical protein [Alteromonas marina]KHT54726.1 hypothetical protein RJ41_05660 [Alteromonas marina]
MKKITTIPFALAFSTTVFAQQEVPHIFTPSTPAKAAEVNENFDSLNSRLNELSEKALPENITIVNVEIDCTENPAALNEAYLENWYIKDLSFNIKGSCYGDIDTPRKEEDPSVQVHGQVLGIYGVDDTAELIDNDLTGQVDLLGGFGGGLYLNNLTIKTSGDFPVFYSRNAAGSVRNVSFIYEGEGYSGDALWIQEGAQVYLSDLTINGFNGGIRGVNGAVVRSLGNINIENVERGVSLQNSLFRGRDAVNISASENAVELDFNSGWEGFDSSLTISSGNIRVADGSTMRTNDLSAPASRIDVEASELGGSNFNIKELYSQGSTVNIGNSVIAEYLEAHNSSYVSIYNTQVPAISVQGSSSMGVWESVVSYYEANKGSFVEFGDVNFEGDVNIWSNSTTFINNSTFNEGSRLNVASGSFANIFGGSIIAPDQYSCYGGTVDIENVDVNSETENNCIDSGGMQDMIDMYKNSRNN